MGLVVPGIVLAAGASVRMGQPKALLKAGDRTFLRRILDALRDGGVPEAVVVLRPGAADARREIDGAAFGRPIENPRPDDGQLSSLLVGLDAVDAAGVDAVLVTLADVPAIDAGTIRILLERAARSHAPIVRAVHGGRHGHPVIFKRAVFEALRRADPSAGAKAVMRTADVEDVEVAHPGVVEDIDTPADYDRLRGMLQQ
jgi:molybdenum cofactor cytidylyltransferase